MKVTRQTREQEPHNLMPMPQRQLQCNRRIVAMPRSSICAYTPFVMVQLHAGPHVPPDQCQQRSSPPACPWRSLICWQIASDQVSLLPCASSLEQAGLPCSRSQLWEIQKSEPQASNMLNAWQKNTCAIFFDNLRRCQLHRNY